MSPVMSGLWQTAHVVSKVTLPAESACWSWLIFQSVSSSSTPDFREASAAFPAISFSSACAGGVPMP